MQVIGLAVFVLLACKSLAQLSPSSEEYIVQGFVEPDQTFREWMKDNNKTYATKEEYAYRFKIWLSTLRYVVEFNAANKTTYWLGLTPFADRTREEYQRISNGAEALTALSSMGTTRIGPVEALPTAQPTNLDWRTEGVVTPITNQGQCASSWAFGTVSTIESAQALVPPRTSPLDLSDQELLDCAPSSQNNGCLGNYPGYAYDTVVSRGLALESNYPYVSGQTGMPGRCRHPAMMLNQSYVSIDGFAYGDEESGVNERAIYAWVGVQPVGVLINADQPTFANYRGGIYDGPCGTDLNHMVTIVGYGTENNIPYWILRNSWGKNWGEDGYMRMKRVTAGQGVCGVNRILAFPLYCGWNAKCERHTAGMKRLMAVKAVIPRSVQASNGLTPEEEPADVAWDGLLDSLKATRAPAQEY